jgi:hypothetical protein
MAREFSISAGGITVAGATTLVAVNPAAAANFNIEFLRYWIGQSANATSAQQRVELAKKASVFPTLTAATPVKLKAADPNASVITGGTAGAIGTAGTNASAEGAGTQTVEWDDAFNVLNGWLHVPTPPETKIYPAGLGNSLELYFPVAPSTLTNWAFGLIFREV